MSDDTYDGHDLMAEVFDLMRRRLPELDAR